MKTCAFLQPRENFPKCCVKKNNGESLSKFESDCFSCKQTPRLKTFDARTSQSFTTNLEVSGQGIKKNHENA